LTFLEIGFVLHKKELICRAFSTDVEGGGQLTDDSWQKTDYRIQTIDDKYLLHKELSRSLKSEILSTKS